MATIDDILEKIREDAKNRFNDQYNILQVLEYKEFEFDDMSLGVPEEGEYYGQVITPGYKIKCDALEKASGKKVPLLYHTDTEGGIIMYNPNIKDY